ncbi:hypothetical protein BJV78DRAFT_1363501 [Lactifluus subvellereus]|nr:hypothetical protein BJV78DRAFT_1363501 [Lactifluus subvellereus]
MSQPPTHEAAQPLSESPVAISPALHIRSTDQPEEAHEGNKRQTPLGEAPSVSRSLLAIVKLSWSNVLLIFIPFSWTFLFAEPSGGLTFIFSFLAIIPLAKLGSFAADELSIRSGHVVACLLEVTLRHAVELIIAITTLVHCELDVVQTSLIGSILSHLLLVLGLIFFAGGIRCRDSEQPFNTGAAQVNSCLLTLSVIALLLPAAFHNALQPTGGTNPAKTSREAHDLLSISYGVAIILLFVYSCYLIFQLISHRILFEPSNPDIQKTVAYSPALARKLADPVEQVVAITAYALIDSMGHLTSSGHINATFVSLILLPNVGNAAEYWHVIDLMVSAKVPVEDNLTLFIGSAMGSSIQIALFVIPFTVTLGWILGKPLTLLFDPFESLALFFSVLTVNYVVQGGKSNWLKGMILNTVLHAFHRN